jgi:hypothetical protein
VVVNRDASPAPNPTAVPSCAAPWPVTWSRRSASNRDDIDEGGTAVKNIQKSILRLVAASAVALGLTFGLAGNAVAANPCVRQLLSGLVGVEMG